MNIEEMFGHGVIRDYLKDRELKPMLGETLFPEDKIDDIDLAYIKGADYKPVAASVHAFDTKTEIASRDGAEAVIESLALIKRQIPMSERLLIKLKKPRTNSEFEKAKQQVFGDVDNMVNSVRARVEAMRMEVLTTGKIQANENGARVTVDYQIPSANFKTLAGTSIWTDPESTPIEDMLLWTDDLVDSTGVMPTRALTSNKVLFALLQNTNLKKAIFGNSAKALSTRELNAFLRSHDLPEIATYNERYRFQKADGTYETRRYFPGNKYVMMPEEALGESIFGLTPEEIELTGTADNEISSQGNITVQVYRTHDPVVTWTKAVATFLPTFPAAGQIVSAQVL